MAPLNRPSPAPPTTITGTIQVQFLQRLHSPAVRHDDDHAVRTLVRQVAHGIGNGVAPAPLMAAMLTK